MAAKVDVKELLKHFDDELANRLAALVNEDKLSADHIKELIRLTSKRADYRDADELESVLEDAEEMDAPAFKVWVDQLIKDEQ